MINLHSGSSIVPITVVKTLPFIRGDRLETIRFLLTVTPTQGDADDTFDMYIQQSYDGSSTNFDDVVHFPQVVASGGAKKYLAEWFRGVTPESEMRAPSNATIAVGVVQGGNFRLPLRLNVVTQQNPPVLGIFSWRVYAEFKYRTRRRR